MNGLKGIRANEVGNEIKSNNITTDEILGLAQSAMSYNDELYSGQTNEQNHYLLNTPELGVHRMENDGSLLSSYGGSKYDDEILFDPTNDTVQNNRFKKQGALTQIGAGLAKGVITAGTTFVDGVAMLTLGIANGIANKLDDNPNTGFMDGMWNNEITKAMQSINDWAEDTFKNYYSTEQERSKWYSASNIFSANFLGDKILKNMGFMVGAFASGSVLTGAKLLPKALGVLTKSAKVAKSAAALEGSLISAVSEGGIEALNNSTEWEKSQIEKLNNDYQQELESLEKMRDVLNPYEYNARINRLNETRENTLKRIQEDKVRMGNLDMLLNIPILTAENLFAWGKLYSSGFKDATRFGKYGKNINVVNKNGNKVLENTLKHKGLSGAKETLNRSVMEGLEEMHQAAASEFSGLIEQQDVDNYFKAALNGEAYERTYDGWKAASEALKNTYGNGDQWEEFVIGAISSVFGMPKVRGIKNKETGKKQSPFIFEGGLIQDIRDANKEYGETQELVDNINKRLADPKFRKQFEGLTAHEYYQKIMDESAQEGNKKDFKDAEAKQFVNDIFMFHKAGLLNNIESIIETAGDLSNLKFDEKGNLLQGNENSEEDKNNLDLIKENDKVKDEDDKYVRSQRGWFNIQDGVATQIKTDKEIVDDISNRKNKILDYIDTYKKTIEDIDYDTNGIFSDDQLTQLAWVKMNKFSDYKRMGSILNDIRNPEDINKPSVKRIKNIIDDDIKSLKKRKNQEEFDFMLLSSEKREIEKLERYSEQLDDFINTDFSDFNEKTEKKYDDLLNSVAKIINYLTHGEYDDIRSQNEYRGYTDENIDSVREQLRDVTNLGNDANKYNKLYNEYIQNPGLLEDQIKEIRNKARIEQVEKKASEIESKLSEAKDLKEFSEIYNNELNLLKQFDVENIDDNIALLENKLKNSKNGNIANLIKAKDIAQKRETAYKKVMSDIFNAEDTSELSQDIADKIGNLTEEQNAELSTQLDDIFSAIEDGHSFEDFKEFVKAVLLSYNGNTNYPTEILDEIANLVLKKFEQIEVAEKANETTDSDDETNPDDEDIDPSDFIPSGDLGGTEPTPPATPPVSTAPQPPVTSNKSEEEKDYIDKLNDISKEDLIKLSKLNNTVSSDSAKQILEFIQKQSESDQKKFVKIIESKLVELQLPTENNGMTPNQEKEAQEQGVKDGIATLQSNETIDEDDKNGTEFVKSWITTLFDFEKLKERIKTFFTAQTDSSQKFLKENGANEFVDKGNLAVLDELYRESHNNKPLPINFVTIAGQNRYNKARKADNRIIYLAVELNDEVKELLNNNKITSKITSTTVNNKNYIVVGACGIYKNNKKSAFNLSNIENLINSEGGLNVNSTSNFVSKYTTEIQNFYSGRFYLEDKTKNPIIGKKERPIKETGVPSFIDPKQILLGVYSNNRIVCPALGLETPIVPLNVNNTINRNGSVWLIIRGADGRYYPTGVGVKRFNSSEYNWENHQDSLIIQKIIECAKKITNKEDYSITDRLNAKYELEKYLGFPSASGKVINPIVIGSDNTHTREVISINPENGIRQNDLTWENGHYIEDKDLRVKKFMNALMACDYRFQVKLSELAGDNFVKYTELLLESNILTTNLISDHNVCGSFEIKPLDPNTGKIINEGSAATTTHISRKVSSESTKALQFNYNEKESLHIEYSDGGIIKTKDLTLTDDQINAAKFAYHIVFESPRIDEYVEGGEHKNLKLYKALDDSAVAIRTGGNAIKIYTKSSNKLYEQYYNAFIKAKSPTQTTNQEAGLNAAASAVNTQLSTAPLSDSDKEAQGYSDFLRKMMNATKQNFINTIENNENGKLELVEGSDPNVDSNTALDKALHDMFCDKEIGVSMSDKNIDLNRLNAIAHEFECKGKNHYKFNIKKNNTSPTTPTTTTQTPNHPPVKKITDDDYSSVEDDDMF